jgi:hypothetical protein
MMQRHQRGQPTPFHPDNARDGVIEVWDAPGGYAEDYRRDIFQSLLAGNEIRVRGRCDSACAEILNYAPYFRTDANPDGQIDLSRAGFMVHEARNNYGTRNDAETRRIMGLYPQEALDRSRVPGPNRS